MSIHRNILEQLITGSAEPVVVAQISIPDWPVVLCNPAFESIVGTDDVRNKPFADVVEQLVGRELALEINETIRDGHDTSIPLEVGKREYLLVLKPLHSTQKSNSKYYAGFLRGGAGATAVGDQDVQQALLKAKRRIRDLSRDDPVTGLLSAKAFRNILDHDWAVAKRERSSLALVSFSLDNFEQYLDVFGRHAADSCQRRVAEAMRHCLRRASDVAARVNGENGDRLIVLSHSADEAGLREFASRIAKTVRELGLHHPRSKVTRYVTVSYQTSVKAPDADPINAAEFLNSVLQ